MERTISLVWCCRPLMEVEVQNNQLVFSLVNLEEYCLELLKNHKAPIYVTWPMFCVTVGSLLPPEAGWWKTPSGP